MQPVEIPRRVDEPPHLLLWSMDEIAPLLIGLVAGVMLDKLLICMVSGIVLMKVYMKFRDNNPDGFMLHVIYWSGIPSLKSKLFINPFIRRLLP